MNIVDFIIYLNEKNIIKKIKYYGEKNKWYEEISWNDFYDKEFSKIFGTLNSSKIIEFKQKLFRYQIIKENESKKIIFSNESAMKLLYEKTLNKVSDGIQIYNKSGYFLYSNPSSEKLEKYNKKDFLGKHILDLYNLNEEYSTTLSVLQSEKPVLNRCDRFKTSEGEKLVTMNSGYPIEINEKIYGAVVFESDLSIVNKTRDKLFNFEEFIRKDKSITKYNGYTFSDIIYKSKIMKEKIDFAKKIALTDTNILIIGETGTGKEIFAQSIHNYSRRRDKKFIDVNCSAIPSNLIESYFFGTKKGSFTGSEHQIGFFEQADGGTLFLDEINSISKNAQAKLLRVIQEGKFQKVGSKEYINCNVRLIAASNEDMRELVEKNIIRKDFYYRIASLSIFIPKLKDRREDIIALTDYYLTKLGDIYSKSRLKISKKVYQRFIDYEWPGNVRELKHIIEYSINKLDNEEGMLEYKHLPQFIKLKEDTCHKKIDYFKENKNHIYESDKSLKEILEKYEEEYLKESLNENNNNITKTAKKLGLSRQSLQYRIKKYNLIL